MHAVVHAAPGTEAPHDGSVTGAVSVSKPRQLCRWGLPRIAARSGCSVRYLPWQIRK